MVRSIAFFPPTKACLAKQPFSLSARILQGFRHCPRREEDSAALESSLAWYSVSSYS